MINGYFDWLKSNSFTEMMSSDTVRISVPFLNRNNDYTEIYVQQRGSDQFFITDDGETLNELELSGFNFTKKRKEFLNMIVHSTGVELGSNNELSITASSSELYFKKHMLVQTMLRVSDMYTQKSTGEKTIFFEEVLSFFEQNDIRYTANISLGGKSKLMSSFDFVIPKSKRAPERVIKTFNNFDSNAAKLLIFSWEDTKVNRPSDSKLIAFVNNQEKFDGNAMKSLSQYDIANVKWTEKESSLDLFTA